MRRISSIARAIGGTRRCSASSVTSTGISGGFGFCMRDGSSRWRSCRGFEQGNKNKKKESNEMNRIRITLTAMIAAVTFGCVTSPAEKAEGEFTFATFNVRCPADRGELAWYRRMPRVAQIVRDHDFDVFGVQEAVPFEVSILEYELPGFRHVGCGRNKDRGGEAMLIFYREDRFDCLEDGTFWLSDRPDEPGSKYPGAGCPRTCTWALLKDKVTGKTFRYFNTHLDHISSKARWNGMQVLLERGVRPAKARGETIFLTGDLDETLDKADDPAAIFALAGPKLAESAKENPIALVSTELKDTYGMSATPHSGTYKTFHGFKGTPRCRIDYIFATPDVKVRSHATLNDKPDGEFASDHYPIAATVGL